jgi:arylsulfatase
VAICFCVTRKSSAWKNPTSIESAKPNFVFFIADDISVDDIGCYGSKFVQTPNLNRIAEQGLVFDNAYLTISSCSPCRCSIITGRYPHNTGAAELHTTLPKDQFMFPHALRDAGYYTLLSGKNHMGKAVDQAFAVIDKGGRPSGSRNWIKLLQDRPKEKPFFFWLASNDAHRGWAINKNAPVYDPEKIDVPPFLFDGPKTRQDLSKYFHEVSRTDHYAGEIIKELERQGIADNTYFVYCADNGRPFPRCKTRLYDSGIKTPLIVWAPHRIKPGRSDSIVSAIDLAATFLELAGIEKDNRVQGVSFRPIFQNPQAKIRDVAFAEHNWHVFQSHERMVRFGDWLYINNSYPQRQSRCMESIDHFPAGKELDEAFRAGKLNENQKDCFLKPRPVEELYHVGKDPHQLKNLAADQKSAQPLNWARQLLASWVKETGDTVPTNPTPDRQRKPGGANRAKEMPGQAANAARINKPGPILIATQQQEKKQEDKLSPSKNPDADFKPDQSKLPVKPPNNAVYLFDGDDQHYFVSMAGEKINWPIEDGALVSTQKRGNINHLCSKIHFRDADIHVEFMLPEKGAGNSGIYIHGNYELQILNSHGKEKISQQDMGSLYGFAPAAVNAARPPGQWQVYDIRYRAPRRDAAGKIIKQGTVTAWLNGKKVQDGTTFGEPKSTFHPFRHGNTEYLNKIYARQKQTSVGPVFLQDHNHKVRFRNIWIKALDDKAVLYEPRDKKEKAKQ